MAARAIELWNVSLIPIILWNWAGLQQSCNGGYRRLLRVYLERLNVFTFALITKLALELLLNIVHIFYPNSINSEVTMYFR